MSNSYPPLAVTGVGIYSAFGTDLTETWTRLCANESAVVEVDHLHSFRNRHAAIIRDLEHLTPSDRMACLFQCTFNLTLADAGLSDAQFINANSAVVSGTSFGALFDPQSRHATVDAFYRAPADVGPRTTPHFTVSSACSSGSDAVALAAELITTGQHEIAFCGGIDVIDKYKIAAHSALGTLSPTICRPFDRRHDGTIFGEGACFLVLETHEHAQRRGAKIRAYLAAHDSSTDLSGLTAPDESGSGAARAVKGALDRAGIRPADVQYVNAHGTGTPINDDMEAAALLRVFHENTPFISSTKAAFGHTLGATGAIEAAMTVAALEHGYAPPTCGLEHPDDVWAATNLGLDGPSSRAFEPRYALSVTYAFGGANTVLLFSAGRTGNQDAIPG